MRVVLIGPPGAGKGTQASRISERFGWVHIATGDILRANAERGTPLGRKAQGYMDRGDLVPDDLVIDMVLERVGEPDLTDGFVLDGFPRTVAQAQALDRRLGGLGRSLDAALAFEIGEAELRHRLAGRAEEQDRVEDEDEEAIARRLELFDRETGPLIAYYDDRGLLARIDAEAEVDEVTERVARALDELASGREAG
jgi:adenylate kinase